MRTVGGAAMAATLTDVPWVTSALATPIAPDCVGPTVGDAAVVGFRKGIVGSVIFPGDLAYPDARLLYNHRFSPRPLMIVRAANEDDVARTIVFARSNGMRLATRSGGHSYIGASGGNGVMLDLSQMNAVTPMGGAHFRIGAGTRLVKAYGDLACNGGWTLPSGSCDSVGFGGIAQGGGFGYLQRAHGLTCDRVRSVRVVRADGAVVQASGESEADLFWAMRGGGGGSFGVATEFEVEAVALRTIHVLGWRWPIGAGDAALARFHQLIESGAMARNAVAAVVFNVDTGAVAPGCVGVVFSTGTLAEADFAKSQLIGRGGVACVPGSEFAYDAATPACNPNEPTGFAYFKAKSSILYAPPAPDTGATLAQWFAARIADPRFELNEYSTAAFISLHGAVADVAPDATAFPHRRALSEVQFLGYWNTPSPAKEAANLDWLRGMYADVAPRLSGGGSGCYVNYADDELPDSDWPGLYYGANYPRLQAIKRAVDPADFFHGRQSVRV